jgi:ammonium transporter Rh
MTEDQKNIHEKLTKIETAKRYGHFGLFICLEIVVITLYGVFTKYDIDGDPLAAGVYGAHSDKTTARYYAFYQDIHVMIFIGFGYLMTFLKSYSWSAVGFNFVIGAWVLQISVLLLGFWTRAFSGVWSTPIEWSIETLINMDFRAATVLVSFGAVLGKLHFSQYLVMATIETIFSCMVTVIGLKHFEVNDVGGGIFIHCFGAYFGLACAIVINSKEKGHFNNPKCKAGYRSNTFAMLGTIFLWMFWPSFNAALVSGQAQHRAICNTLMSLTGSCITVFLLGPFFKKGKFNMTDVINATISGGVMVGSAADIILWPWAALLIGVMAGLLSTVGFNIIGPFLERKINMHDTCGVHNLHGMTGLWAGLITAIVTGTMKPEEFGPTLSELLPKVATGERTLGHQAGYQLAAIALAMSVGIITGAITGFILKNPLFEEVEEPFDDHCLWETKDDEGLALMRIRKFEKKYEMKEIVEKKQPIITNPNEDDKLRQQTEV